MDKEKRDTFELLYKTHYKELYIHALSFVRDDEEAKDIVTDVYEYVWKNFDKLDSSVSLRPFLYTLVRSRSLDFLRKEKTKEKFLAYKKTFPEEEEEYVEYDSLSGINYNLAEGGVVRYHTLRVPKGAEYKLTLNDGTVVWLNSESELRYPTSFVGEKREVFLTGEGYFSVAYDEKQPFIVVSSDIYTKVYGTEFNVRSYGDEEVHVTLVQGRVSVKKTEGGSEYTLNPGENARFVESVPEITKVNVNRYIAWKDGYFYYENESMESIMDDLKRWYDFDVVYVGNRVKDYRFELWVSRDSEISVITDLLMKTNRVGIKVNGKTLVVSEVVR